MIVLTGAAGFIGSCVLTHLNNLGVTDIAIVDDFSPTDKERNWKGKHYVAQVDRDELFDWLGSNPVEGIIHLGARTDTTEFDESIFERLNINFSKDIWKYATKSQVPLIYASSAATYGLGEHGYKDEHSLVASLKPLNPYGVSKNVFDQWVLEQTDTPPFWAGLKFFNVYGPNEYHKGRMASVIFHAFNQIKETGKVKLFRSHNPDYKDGEQLRDFIYVMDVCEVITYLWDNTPESGLYNLGTGKARTFLDLAKGVFSALELDPNIEFIDTPADIRDKYQYFTEADMGKLITTGYSKPFIKLEDGIKDYVVNYLQSNKAF